MRTEAEIKAELEAWRAKLGKPVGILPGFITDDTETREGILDHFLTHRIQSFVDALEWVLGNADTDSN